MNQSSNCFCNNDFKGFIIAISWRWQWPLKECLGHQFLVWFDFMSRSISSNSINAIAQIAEMLNTLWSFNTIWRQRSGSTLTQVMACWLTAPSHYLSQCWLIISGFWHSFDSILTVSAQAIILYDFENYTFKIPATSPRANELNHPPWTKWPPFRRRYFQMHFHEWKVLYFNKIDNNPALV